MKSKWSNEVTFTTEIRFHAPTELAAGNITTTSAEISWTADAAATGAVLEYATTEGAGLAFSEYKYDNGELATSVGLGGDPFQWGVMFPAGSYSGSYLSKVSVFDPKEMTGTVTIYNDGVTAPENAISTVPVTFTGAGEFIDIAIDATIDDTKNVWVIFYNESGTDYPAACSNDDLGDANGRWVEINGTWYDLAGAGVSGKCFMVRAEIGTADLSTLTWTTVADATSPYELTGLTPETTYAVRVKSIFEEGESKWTSTLFTTETNNPVPANIVADLAADGATLTWEGEGDSYNVQYRTAADATPIFWDDFSEGLDKWTVVTAGEGPGWVIGTETGQNAATAYSWSNNVSYNADNWLISPEIELGNLLQFYAATATSYPDSYEVLLSTTGNEIADFTVTLQEMNPATSGYVTIDLSAYAGQKGYIAFHHVSNDCYLLAVDDFGIYNYVPASEWQNITVTENTATISGLDTNNLYEYQIQSVKGEKTSAWSTLDDFALLTLDSNVDNAETIYKYGGTFAHVTLTRTLNAGGWNTFCAPFSTATPDGWTVKELTGSELNGESLTLNFGDAAGIEAGKPYLVQVNDKVENLAFSNVTIDDAITPTKTTYADFVPVMNPTFLTGGDESILFVTGGNNLTYPAADGNIKGFRAYFKLNDANEVRAFSMDFGDSEATGIIAVDTVNGESNATYDLQGRKVLTQPTHKGVYIVNGKKVIIK